MVEITGVLKGSFAYKAKIFSNDILISINNHEIKDVLDYMFYSSESKLNLKILRAEQVFEFDIIKGEYDDLGLEFDSFLMDDKKSCHNKCVFCFIDQMPKGMRETLYFKDDDARLSFLHGNYVTLTNLEQDDVDRIINMKLNINISVHTTNSELRCKMMNNRFAGEKLVYLKQMSDSGIKMNCQIVLCPGLNDGEELNKTLSDLGMLMPNIQSIAVVPVGLSKFREGLYPLKSFTRETAELALNQILEFQKYFLEKYSTRLVFPSDEFFLLARKEIPEASFYEEYQQYENGVGMLRSFEDEFNDAFETEEEENIEKQLSIATGYSSYDMIKKLVEKIKVKFPKIICNVYPIKNYFFGEKITVTGLITAGDLINQLEKMPLGDELLISSSMLKRDEPIFLDDYTVMEVEEKLKVKIKVVSNDGYDFLDSILR